MPTAGRLNLKVNLGNIHATNAVLLASEIQLLSTHLSKTAFSFARQERMQTILHTAAGYSHRHTRCTYMDTHSAMLRLEISLNGRAQVHEPS